MSKNLGFFSKMGLGKIGFGQMGFVINPYTTGFFVGQVGFGEMR